MRKLTFKDYTNNVDPIHVELSLFVSSPDALATVAHSLLHEEAMDMWEMANLHGTTTGLDNLVVWVSGGGSQLQHGPRIKVVKGTKFRPENSSTVPLTGVPRIIGNADLSQDEFAEVIKWIRLNRETILQYWNDDISTEQMISAINKI